MILLKNSLIDAQLSWERGEDTFTSPSRVPRNQACLLVNQITRNDYLGPRPYWKQLPLTFDIAGTQTGFEDGYFQKFTHYMPDHGEPHLIFSISGRLFRVDALSTAKVGEFTLPEVNPTTRPTCWFKQAELFLIWQDGQSRPLIYTGAGWRASDIEGTSGTDADGTPLYEIPVGTCMEYYNGRLWVALADRAAFVAGDGVFGPTGTEAYQSRDAVLRFTENTYLAGGGAFAVPSNLGGITAMRATANLDTSLGQGAMQVFTPSGAFSVDAPFDRETWANLNYPIKAPSLFGNGFLSQESAVLVNGDIWGRSLNGILPFLVARRDFGMWANRDMSREVGAHLVGDDRYLLDRSSGALFDNRLLMTCAPQLDKTHGVYHQGLAVLDFFPLTSVSRPVDPVWQGLWNGPDILQIHSFTYQGVDYCFAAVLAPEDDNGARKIQLWQLTRDSGPDVDSAGTETPVTRYIDSPRFDFSLSGSNRLEQKTLEAADLWCDKISGTVDFYLYYRPDEYPGWFLWKHWQVCAKTKRCAADAVDGCLTDLNLQRQFRARIGALRPPENWIESSNSDARIAYAFQYRLKIVGDVELTAVRLLANRIVEATFGMDAPEVAECEELVVCPDLD